jgi:hypothetical protein
MNALQVKVQLQPTVRLVQETPDLFPVLTHVR